jgi:hypothetical protein
MNVLIQPVSGSIYFDSNPAGSSTTTSGNLTLSYNNSGGLIVASNNSGNTLRFAVSGGQGGLFSVYDSLTGQIFAVNKIGGIPIVEVYDTDTVKLGTYLSNTLLVSGTQVSMGGYPIAATVPNKLSVIGNTSTTGTLSSQSVIYDIAGNSTQWNSSYNTSTTYQRASSSFVNTTVLSQTTNTIFHPFLLGGM